MSTVLARLSDYVASLTNSKRAWLVTAVLAFLLAKKLRKYMQLQHSCMQNSKSALRRPIQNQFPEYIKNEQGMWLYTKVWPVPSPRAAIVISHGFGEHILRYEHVARFFNANGIMVCGLDHQGHGQSEGDRAHVVSFDDYVNDLAMFAKKVQSDNPDLPMFLLGHSMGGTIATQCMRGHFDLFVGAMLSAPAFMPDPAIATPFMKFLARVMSRIVPKLPVDKLPAEHVSSDAQVVAKYCADPLIYRGGMRTNWAWQFLLNMEDIRLNVDSIEFPYLLMHGTADRLSMFAGSERFFANSKSADKQFKQYWNFSHELLNEQNHQQVMDDCLQFVVARLPHDV